MGSLRIGIVAPPWFAVPPVGYGGIEWVVSTLAEGLVERGHHVTLFASGGSQTRGRLVSTYAEPPSAQLGDAFVEAPALLEAYAHWDEFDIIHDHTMLGLIAGANVPVPVAHTVHGQVIPTFYRLYERLAGRVEVVAISRNQASTLPPSCRPTVIYNGTDLERFPFAADSRGEYLLFVGRMSPEKGILSAIEIARRVAMPLLVLAKVNEQPEREYFEALVKPALRGVEHEVRLQSSHTEKVAAYQNALATLFPIDWPEPFGLVMTESMACGTPVIAFRRGSVPEVIADGRTGFVCDGIEQAAEAAGRTKLLSRADCRAWVEENFSAERNVALHEELFLRMAGAEEPEANVLPAPSAAGLSAAVTPVA